MAKRFTDTEKWKKPFIRGLQAPYKLLWLYICDDCDHAGIWQVDMDVAQIRVGEKLNEQKALEFFCDKVIPIDGGLKWYIPSFIEFQYPSGLNANNKAHVGIIKILEKYKNQIDKFKHLLSPLDGAMDMDMDKDKDKDMDMDMDMEEEKEKEKDEKKNSKIKKLATHQEMGEEYKKWFYDKKMVDPKISNVDYAKLTEIKKEIIRQISRNGRDATESEVLEAWKIILSACELDDFIFNKSEANLKVIASSLNKLFALIMRQKSGTVANSKIEKGVENITLKDVRLRSSF